MYDVRNLGRGNNGGAYLQLIQKENVYIKMMSMRKRSLLPTTFTLFFDVLFSPPLIWKQCILF